MVDKALLKIANLELVTNTNDRYACELVDASKGKIKITISDFNFLVHVGVPVTLEVCGNNMMYVAKNVIVEPAGVMYIYIIRDAEFFSVNRRRHRRVVLCLDSYLTQGYTEYNATIIDLSLGGARIRLKEGEISLLGVYTLNFELLGSSFSLDCRVRGSNVEDEFIILRLEFFEYSARVERMLSRALNTQEVRYKGGGL